MHLDCFEQQACRVATLRACFIDCCACSWALQHQSLKCIGCTKTSSRTTKQIGKVEPWPFNGLPSKHLNIPTDHLWRLKFCYILPLNFQANAFLSTNFCPSRFLGSEDITNFFSRAQRSRIVFEILCTTPFGREKKGEVGVRSLVDQGAFSAAFPLHDVSSFKMLVTFKERLSPPGRP